MASAHAQYEQDVLRFFGKLPAQSFETVHCPFCSPNQKPVELFTKETLKVVRCQCGFVFSQNQPKQETLNGFYSASSAMDNWASLKQTRAEDIRQKEKFQSAVSKLKELGVQSVLDIGCGTGKFLSLVSERIPKAKLVGIDQHDKSLEVARSFGIETHNTSIEKFLKEDPWKFDAITLWGVLEHVKDPVGLLKLISKKLTGPRIIVVCVPNVESKVVKTLWSQCFTFCPQHLWYFSKATLSKAFKAAGFKLNFHYTIEPESVPIMKYQNGFHPYSDPPPWVWDKYLKDPDIQVLNQQTINTNDGYKIVAIGNL